jgi:hypothetical protein
LYIRCSSVTIPCPGLFELSRLSTISVSALNVSMRRSLNHFRAKHPSMQ